MNSYIPPKIWDPPHSEEQAFGGLNRPTAGKRFQKDLPIGKHPLQLYSAGTPNGHKVTILLEELGVPYDAWKITLSKGEQFSSGFTEINPNQKIPAMVDNSLQQPVRVFESVSILIYLADKYKRFFPADITGRTECMNWLIWQAGIGASLGGGFGHFYKYAPVKIKYAIDRYTMEVKRILDVLDQQLDGRRFVIGQGYTIADMAIFPWIRTLIEDYQAGEFLQIHKYKNIARWMDLIESRPAVQRALRIHGTGPNAILNRHSPADFEPKAHL